MAEKQEKLQEVDYLEKARELADSYLLLIHRRDLLRQQYEDSQSWFYTKDEIIYKLSQGAHEESERVQTSGTSNPVERTVLNCDKVLASMNREVQTQRTEQFLEPYYKVCEDIELFEIGLRSLRGLTRIVAEQLFVDGKKQTEITGLDGKFLGRRVVEREKQQKKCWRSPQRCAGSMSRSKRLRREQKLRGSKILRWQQPPSILGKRKCTTSRLRRIFPDTQRQKNG